MSQESQRAYGSFVAEYYDYLPVTAGRGDVALYLEFARLQGGPILELGCGTGRILLPIARAGHPIVGLDLSPDMLARCQTKLASEPPEVRERVQILRGDITNFDLDGAFGLVIIPFRPFQHLLSVDQQLACLGCVQRHLRPAGKLIVDFFQTDPRRMYDPAFMNESSAFPEVTLPDGRKLKMTDRTRAFHRAVQQNEVEMAFYVTHPDGRTERLVHSFTLRYFFRYEVEHLLARGGFRLVELFGDFDRSPLRDDSREMIFVAEKSAS